MKGILGSALLGLVLLGLFTAPFSQAETLDGAKGRYLAQKDKYQNARQVFLDDRADYVQAKLQWDKFKNNGDDLTAKAKKQIGTGLDLSIAYLNNVNTLLDWSANWYPDAARHKTTINVYISDLQGYRGDLDKATTRAQIFAVSSKVRNKWSDVRADLKRITGDILSAKVALSIQQADSSIAKVKEVMAKRTAMGDTATANTLNPIIVDAEEKLANAKTDYAQAKVTFAGISNIAEGNSMYNQGHQFLKSANKYLTGVYKDLKEVQRQIRDGRPVTNLQPSSDGAISGGVFTPDLNIQTDAVAGAGFIQIDGTGQVTLVGTATTFIVSTNAFGTITVTGPAEVDAVGSGFNNKVDNADGSVTYSGRGELALKGDGLKVVVDGTDVSIFAQGEGSVKMTGAGIYETGKCTMPQKCVTTTGPQVYTDDTAALQLQ